MVDMPKPNFYNVEGGGIQVTYSTTSIKGTPVFTYHDASGVKEFSGEQIKVAQTDIGTLVTVTLQILVDRGSTTFSLLLPLINLTSPAGAHITVEGITTLNKFQNFPVPGQAQSYTVTEMQGIATIVRPEG
jgi:hypothetical protein